MAAARPTWQPPLALWALLGVAALVFVHEAQPARLEGHWLVLTPIAIALGLLAMRRLWQLPPAVTMCGALALTVFSGGWSQMGFGNLPLNRLLILAVVLQVLLRSPGAATVPGIRIRGVHLLLALTLLYAVGSAAAAATLGTESSFLLLVDVFGLTPFLLFVIAPVVFAGQRERDLLLATLVGLGAYLGLTAIFESLGPHALVFPSFIRHIDLESVAEAKASGPFQSPTAMGFGCFACAVGAVIALQRWSRPRARWLALAVAVVCLFGCLLTLERGVWIATAAGVLVAALAIPAGRRWLLPGVGLAALVVAGSLALSPQLSHQVSTRATYQQSLWDRKNQTSTGLRMVEARPLFGFGLGRYEAESVDYFRQPYDYPMSGYFHGVTIGVPDEILPIHNTYLAYAVELGLLGFVLWLACVFWAVGEALLAPGPASLRPWKVGLLSIAVFFLVMSFVDPHTAPFPMVVLFVWAGLARGTTPETGMTRFLADSSWKTTPAVAGGI
ncbi:MAG: O-antigen ligase family protein [Solirubrobacterales bacterium]|nr:O-antigen ligase family protein [Solirubrobacterales bacterium]